jgi:hypothetical protein
MDIQEVKKDIKNIQISKNVVICILSVALVLVSAVAIGLAVGGEENGDRGERNSEGMMGQRYDDNDVNLNDGETNDDQVVPIEQSAKPVPITPATTSVAPAIPPKTQ